MNEKNTTAKDFFIHFGALVTLYATVISLVSLLFAIINQVFPDSVSWYGGDSYTIRWTISSLIIVFPVYIYLARTIAGDARNNPIKREYWIRKWSKYLTLFLTGAAIAVDLIVLINTYLGGEISIRFILKVVALLVVAGFTFYYYAKDSHEKPNTLIAIASVLVVGSIIGGFVAGGSPSTQRALRFDAERRSDLSNIQSQIGWYVDQKKELPKTLADLNETRTSFVTPTDPRTGASYVYEIVDADSYKLCATFERTSAEEDTYSYAYPGESWKHGVGYTCFDRNEIITETTPLVIPKRAI